MSQPPTDERELKFSPQDMQTPFAKFALTATRLMRDISTEQECFDEVFSKIAPIEWPAAFAERMHDVALQCGAAPALDEDRMFEYIEWMRDDCKKYLDRMNELRGPMHDPSIELVKARAEERKDWSYLMAGMFTGALSRYGMQF